MAPSVCVRGDPGQAGAVWLGSHALWPAGAACGLGSPLGGSGRVAAVPISELQARQPVWVRMAR